MRKKRTQAETALMFSIGVMGISEMERDPELDKSMALNAEDLHWLSTGTKALEALARETTFTRLEKEKILMICSHLNNLGAKVMRQAYFELTERETATELMEESEDV